MGGLVGGAGTPPHCTLQADAQHKGPVSPELLLRGHGSFRGQCSLLWASWPRFRWRTLRFASRASRPPTGGLGLAPGPRRTSRPFTGLILCLLTVWGSVSVVSERLAPEPPEGTLFS